MKFSSRFLRSALFCIFYSLFCAASLHATITPGSVNQGSKGITFPSVQFRSDKVNPRDRTIIWRIYGKPPGLRLDSKGRYLGTPKKDGTYQVTVKVFSRQKRRLVPVDALPFTHTIGNTPSPTILGPFELPSGKFDERYQGRTAYRLKATGGLPYRGNIYRWELLTGSKFQTLPKGMTLSRLGVISGVPRERAPIPQFTQTYSFRVRVTDMVGNTDIRTFTLVLAPVDGPLILTECPLPEVIEKERYPRVTLKGKSGRPPYKWSISPQKGLPLGLTLDTKRGLITGKPTQAGTYPFDIVLRDANGMTATKSCSITIRPAPEIQVREIFKCARVGDAASETIQALGGDQPYTWSATGLPPGLVIDSKGRIFGRFTKAGAYNVAVKVVDKGGNKDTETFTFTVKPALEITAASPLPVGIFGSPYPGKNGSPTVKIDVTGGRPPYQWTKIKGYLPPGLTIDSDTGIISGVPTLPGTYRFTIRVEDSCKEGLYYREKEFEITIYYPLSVQPDPVACATVGKPINFNVTASGMTAPYTWSSVTSSSPLFSLTVPNAANSRSATISGVPSQAGTVTLSYSVTSSGVTENFSTNISVNPRLEITSDCPAGEGTVGTPFPTGALSATGGYGNYTWTATLVSNGSAGTPSPTPRPGQVLPPTNNTSAVGALPIVANRIAWTPTTAGDFKVILNVQDECGNIDSKECDVKIYPALSCNQTLNLPCLVNGMALQETSVFAANGGKPPYVWTLQPIGSGNKTLPVGLQQKSVSDSDSSILFGTVTESGSFPFTATVTDALGNTCSENHTIVINPELELPTNCPLPSGTVGSAYSGNFTATGGNGNYTWSIVEPTSLPDGLTLNASTGRVEGTPETSGNFSFSYQVADSCGQEISANCTIEIKENAILSCLKELWVVVDYPGYGGHSCNSAKYEIYANDEKIMVANLNNVGGSADWVFSPGSAETTFIFPHPEYPSITGFTYGGPRYNRVLITGSKLFSIASKSSGGIVKITAICSPGTYCSHWDGVGQLRIYTSNSTSGSFSDATQVFKTSANGFKPDANGVSVNVCNTVVLSNSSITEFSSALGVQSSAAPAGVLSINYSTMAQVSVSATANQSADNLILNSPFNISNYEVTNEQYAAFLNAIANIDSFKLYNPLMSSIGIKKDSNSSSLIYSVDSGMGNYPITFVSWYDAARFANWLANGKPTGAQDSTTTENGVYDLASPTMVRNAINPNTGLPPTHWLLNESEWYTSAYLKSDFSDIWKYPTQSDKAPDASGSDPTNFANFGNTFGGPTPVGFFDQSPGPFGTFDQGGNVREWTETLDTSTGTPMRIIRGGSWADPLDAMRADESHIADPNHEDDKTGFRIGGAP